MANICILISIVLYLAFMVGVGVWYTKRNNSADDFYLGGRKLGPYATAMSAEASDMSSWLLMGLPGLAFFNGLADPFWTAVGLAVGTWFNWLLVAKPLRYYSAEISAITVPEFFSKRFGDKKRLLQGLAAVVIIVFFVPYTASGFAACGKLFSSLFGWDYMACMIVSAVVIVGYTVLGGFLAASVTDLIQSVIMSIALACVLVFGIFSAGGLDNVISNASQVAGYLKVTAMGNILTGESTPYGLLTIVSTMAWGLGYFGMPHILLRFMAIEEPDKLKVSRRVGTIWVVISMFVAIFIGIVGYGMVQNGAMSGFESASAAEAIIVSIAKLISQHGVLAALLAGLILAGILASTMSTADSQLLAASSSVSHDLLGGLFKKELSTKQKMLVARTSLAVIAVLGVLLAQDPNSSVFTIVSFAWAGFGASFGPSMLCALFWKRTTWQGSLAGMLSGGVMVFVWKFLVKPMGGVFGIYELLPAFLVGLAAIIIVSLITKAPEKDITGTFDAVKAMK
ncbi:MAG: sodium/proline symporter [Clostridia bacterium]|nr:sodium/proline symporter [Clostridia bacterium]